MPWHWRRPPGTGSPSVVPALLAALALLLGVPLASTASSPGAVRLAGGGLVAVAAAAPEGAERLAHQSTPILKHGRADLRRSGPQDPLDRLGATDPARAGTPRLSPAELAPAHSLDPLPAPTRSNLRSRAPPPPHAVLASGIPLRRR